MCIRKYVCGRERQSTHREKPKNIRYCGPSKTALWLGAQRDVQGWEARAPGAHTAQRGASSCNR